MGCPETLRAWRHYSNATPGLPHSVPRMGLDHLQPVTEYKPVVHRLRHLALGLGPTNPTWTNLPSEPLGIRWAGFSPAFCYSYRHSHSKSLHRSFRDDFNALSTLPYHSLVRIRGFGDELEPRYILGAGPLDQ